MSTIIIIGGGPHPQATIKADDTGVHIVDGDTTLLTTAHYEVAERLLPLIQQGLDNVTKA